MAGCDNGGSASKKAPTPVSSPSAAEASLFASVLSDPDFRIDRMCISPVTATPGRQKNRIEALSFGDGKVVRAGDRRYDEAIGRYDRAISARPLRLRITGIAHDRRDPGACDWELTFDPPYFDNDMAFVVANERHAQGGVRGGEFRLWVFRKLGNKWTPIAYGQSTYGRPVI